MDKENLENGERIISAQKPDGVSLINITIFHLDKNFSLKEKIIAKKANIEKNEWKLNEVTIFKSTKNIIKEKN